MHGHKDALRLQKRKDNFLSMGKKKKDRSETESMLGKKTDRDLEDIYTNFHSELHTHDPI